MYAAFAAVYEELADEAQAALWRQRADRAADLLDEADHEQDEVEIVLEAQGADGDDGAGPVEPDAGPSQTAEEQRDH